MNHPIIVRFFSRIVRLPVGNAGLLARWFSAIQPFSRSAWSAWTSVSVAVSDNRPTDQGIVRLPKTITAMTMTTTVTMTITIVHMILK